MIALNDMVARIVAYENGDLDYDECVDLFQALIDNGVVWKLQGFYGRLATQLIEEGICHS